jgi:hypothetical protein
MSKRRGEVETIHELQRDRFRGAEQGWLATPLAFDMDTFSQAIQRSFCVSLAKVNTRENRLVVFAPWLSSLELG